tara:strand:- start:1030 stop:1338 length:309 start_codon:yes stop_codon:yes gene_type:complete
MRGTINFIITENVEEHVFSKDTFKYMYSSYSTGATAAIRIYFQAENNLIDHDLIRLTVNKEFVSRLMLDISKKLNEFNHSEVKHNQSTGLYKQNISMTYTAG